MWKQFFQGKESTQPNSKEEEDETVLSSIEMRKQIDIKLQLLTKQFQQSQAIFKECYQINGSEEILCSTFQELIATIEGLVTIIQTLKVEYDEMQDKLRQHSQLKNMLSNHQNIITSIQQTYSQQMKQLYESKKIQQQHLQGQIEELQNNNQALMNKIEAVEQELDVYRSNIEELKYENLVLAEKNKEIQEENNRNQQKYQILWPEKGQTIKHKMIDIEHPQLEYLFYYSKLRERLIPFLGLPELVSLEATSKFFFLLLHKSQSQFSYNIFRRKHNHKQTAISKAVQLYQKIYELFPAQNIKINAFKYLYFKIKPATYILPYLQQQQIDLLKKEVNPQDNKHSKFSWKSLFNSEKKEQNKFSLANLKNQEEFKKVQDKIQATFKNILNVTMPQDLEYFNETMEKQLQELKHELGQHRQGKMGQTEWIAQLYCLTRYMYHQISQLYNLLQVIFGELLNKNKSLLALEQSYEYLQQNQVVLRNLIENISSDKALIEKKIYLMENQIIKNNLEKEAALASRDRLEAQLLQLQFKYSTLESEHSHCKAKLDRLLDDRRNVEQNMAAIRQELQVLEKIPGKRRKTSVDITGSLQQQHETLNTS